MRAIYSEYIGGDGTIRRMLDRLAELDQVKVSRMSFQQTSNKQLIGHSDAEHPGGRGVDDQFEFRRVHYRQIRRLRHP